MTVTREYLEMGVRDLNECPYGKRLYELKHYSGAYHLFSKSRNCIARTETKKEMLNILRALYLYNAEEKN